MIGFRIFILLMISSSLHAEEAQIEALFKSSDITGSILIESGDGAIKHQYNVNDKDSFVPASTFKIPNTLIILEEGLIKGTSEIIKWDGKEREYASWNKDQTLKSAFQYSCVWCYQFYARQIGHKKYHEYLRKFNYGNYLTGSDIARFWLDGDLRISVDDQIKFLRKVYAEDLPVKNSHIKTLKSIMLSEENEGYKVWSKTGWSGKDGWFVGYVLVDEQEWFFATHIEVTKKSDLALRKKLTMESLKLLKIIH
jgi:beta-lactamase class D